MSNFSVEDFKSVFSPKLSVAQVMTHCPIETHNAVPITTSVLLYSEMVTEKLKICHSKTRSMPTDSWSKTFFGPQMTISSLKGHTDTEVEQACHHCQDTSHKWPQSTSHQQKPDHHQPQQTRCRWNIMEKAVLMHACKYCGNQLSKWQTPFLKHQSVSFTPQAGCKKKNPGVDMTAFALEDEAAQVVVKRFWLQQQFQMWWLLQMQLPPLYSFQPTHKYFQHQGIFSTSHWWTAPIHVFFFFFFQKGCTAKATTAGLDSLNFKKSTL